MAAPLFRTALRSSSQKMETSLSNISSRNYRVQLGAREKALLEEDPALKKFKPFKKTAKQISKIGSVLTVFAIYVCSAELSYRFDKKQKGVL